MDTPGNPPPKVIIDPVAFEPEQLTDLTDDSNLEMWAQGGTKILADAPQGRAPSYPAVAISYGQPVAAMPPKKGNVLVWVVGLGLAAAFGMVVLAAGVGFFLYRQSHLGENSREATQQDTLSRSPKALGEDDPNLAAPRPPLMLVTSDDTTSKPAPLTVPATTAAAPVTSATHGGSVSSLFGDDDDKPAPPARNGVLQTFAAASGKPVYVDGTRVGSGGSRIKTACGKHLVTVGTGKSKVVDIPCNGTPVTVGSPDGT